jgi:hypothetical protein
MEWSYHLKMETPIRAYIADSHTFLSQKTALFLIIATDGFSKFVMALQLCSYLVITPTILKFGSRVRN